MKIPGISKINIPKQINTASDALKQAASNAAKVFGLGNRDEFLHSEIITIGNRVKESVIKKVKKINIADISKPLNFGEQIKMEIACKDIKTGKPKMAKAVFFYDNYNNYEKVIVTIPGHRGYAYAHLRLEDTRDWGKHIFIEYMNSKTLKGGGTLLHQAIAQRSIQTKYDGCVALEAAPGTYIFHYKSGFRPKNVINPKIMIDDLEWLADLFYNPNTNKIYRDGKENMPLFLSPIKARKLLTKKAKVE